MTHAHKKIGYLRVSRKDQSFARQIDGLKIHCDEMRIEQVSAASRSRPVFDTLIASLASGDTLVVWDLDRAFRSTIDAVTQAELLRERGVNFQIVTLNVDTATPDGMLVYTVMAAIAEHERKRLAKRTREGLAAARKRGKRLGRPPKMSKAEVREAHHKLEAGAASITEIASAYNVHPWTLSRALKRLNEEAHPM